MLKELFVFWFKFTWEVIKQTASSMFSCGERKPTEKKSSLIIDLFSYVPLLPAKAELHVFSPVKLWGGKQRVRHHPAEIQNINMKVCQNGFSWQRVFQASFLNASIIWELQSLSLASPSKCSSFIISGSSWNFLNVYHSDTTNSDFYQSQPWEDIVSSHC